jgi:hypothetical protein
MVLMGGGPVLLVLMYDGLHLPLLVGGGLPVLIGARLMLLVLVRIRYMLVGLLSMLLVMVAVMVVVVLAYVVAGWHLAAATYDDGQRAASGGGGGGGGGGVAVVGAATSGVATCVGVGVSWRRGIAASPISGGQRDVFGGGTVCDEYCHATEHCMSLYSAHY